MKRWLIILEFESQTDPQTTEALRKSIFTKPKSLSNEPCLLGFMRTKFQDEPVLFFQRLASGRRLLSRQILQFLLLVTAISKTVAFPFNAKIMLQWKVNIVKTYHFSPGNSKPNFLLKNRLALCANENELFRLRPKPRGRKLFLLHAMQGTHQLPQPRFYCLDCFRFRNSNGLNSPCYPQNAAENSIHCFCFILLSVEKKKVKFLCSTNEVLFCIAHIYVFLKPLQRFRRDDIVLRREILHRF